MIVIIILLTIGFSLISFFPGFSSSTNYYFYLISYFFKNPLVAITLIVGLLIYFKLTHPHKVKTLAFQSLVLAYLASGLFIYFLAFMELNILAFVYQASPKSLGVFSQIDDINSRLLKYNLAPKIIASEKQDKAAIFALAEVSSGTDNFYGKHILKSFPAVFVLTESKNQPDILLVDDTLIISQVTSSQIQKLSPALGYLLVQNYFTQSSIIHFPKVDLISVEEYKNFRRNDFIDKLKLVDLYQKATQDSIATYSAQITGLELSSSQSGTQIQTIYRLIDKNPKNKADLYDQVSNLHKTIDVNNTLITENRTKLTDAQALTKFFDSQKILGEKLIDNIPSERGSFYPPDTIKLSFPDSSPHSVVDYLANLVHEYLHYASYAGPDSKLNNPFFEEGLTEFYARKIIAEKLNVQTNLGYPVLVKIFTKLAKNLPDSDLLEIYFTKNESALIRLIDRVYGKNFYAQNQNLFLAIQSTNDRQKLLPLANLLMSKIHGEPLTEQDLISTFSNY